MEFFTFCYWYSDVQDLSKNGSTNLQNIHSSNFLFWLILPQDVSLSLKLVSMNLWNDIMRVNFNTRNFLESLVISLRHQLVIFERTVIYQIQILEEIVEQILLRFENYILTRGIVLQTYYDHFDESILQLEDKINGRSVALVFSERV